ncbi:MAG: DUF3460 family protein [Proteobacteria bacterium]|nr:DUF3460 family protein [Pseudomonadota bacterium]MCL2308312.1 DUF3460 family protein [Pseudomonadota bacterium]
MSLNLLLPSHLFVSEADALLRDYLRAHPETIDRQKEGLQIWWGGQLSEVRDQKSEKHQHTKENA